MNRFSRLTHRLLTRLNNFRHAPPSKIAQGLLSLFYHSIFWLWNGLFLMVVYLGFLPLIGVPLMMSLAAGAVPFPFVLPLAALLLVPPICTLVGLFKLRKHPVLLMRLFYGVEVPIMALCLLRMFILRELTPASTLIVVAGAMAIATVAMELVSGYAAYNRGLAWFQMMAHTVVLMVGLYVGAILLFYTVPVLCQLLYAFIRLDWLDSLIDSIRWSWSSYHPDTLGDLIGWALSGLGTSLLVLGTFALFGASATLFVAMPFTLVALFVSSWSRIQYAFAQQYDRRRVWLVTGSVATLLGASFWLTSSQPQTAAFALLEQTPDSAIVRQQLVQQSPQIRQGLLNAYLMPYRYLSPWNQANALQRWYPTVFPMTRAQAGVFQTMHNALLSPFLYRGDRADVQKAADLYAAFFDTPIQRAEAQAIQHALQSTVNRDSVEASLLNISDRVVALARQEVSVTAQGDWAEVTLYERYENRTLEDQEIVYQFSLPESAVITGLWLGEPGLPERYRFVVSPRGAAQQVYKQEIERAEQTRAEDPALLEQVGPRQYRLRVFPIPRRQSRHQPGITHLWMTYQVIQQEGAWPLPQLTEKRNLYWTEHTERYRRGQALKQPGDTWYEPAIPADTIASPTVHTATLAEGYRVTATPMTTASAVPLKNQRLAILVDTSLSMGDRADALASALQKSRAIAPDNTVDWYFTSAPGMPAQRFSGETLPAVEAIPFYGNLPLTKQLQQFEALRQGENYDAVVVLTDAGNYELENDEALVPSLPGSLWLVHLGSDVPTAYTDALQQHLYESRGGIATDLSEVINRLATEGQISGTMMAGYRWEIVSTTDDTAQTVTDTDEVGFAPFAARQTIRWLSRDRDVTQVEELDRLHAIAKRTEVVTPYSSMLVLVNDRQREALQAAENSIDRFAREIETGEDTLTTPGNPLGEPVGIPESGGPLSLLLAGGGLLWMMWRDRVHRNH